MGRWIDILYDRLIVQLFMNENTNIIKVPRVYKIKDIASVIIRGRDKSIHKTNDSKTVMVFIFWLILSGVTTANQLPLSRTGGLEQIFTLDALLDTTL